MRRLLEAFAEFLGDFGVQHLTLVAQNGVTWPRRHPVKVEEREEGGGPSGVP